MSLATPLWFDPTYYAEQKLDQLSLLKWDGKTGWTNSAYEAELAKYGVTPYENFVASNEVHNLELTNLSPNRLFNVNEYLTALAQYANKTGYSYPGYKAGEWTAQKAMEHMFNDYHVSAWDHFTLAGQFNLINPSNAFDITAYYDQLTAWRNSYVDPETGAKGWEGRTDWTRDDVIEDNIWNQVNPIEGLFGEAAGSGIRPQPVAAKDQVKVDSDWNPWVASIGQTPGTSNPIKPGKPVPGGSTGSGGDDGADDGWHPDEKVSVGNDKGVYTGSDGEDTLFEAKNGLNPDSVIDGGEDSENVLNVNMKGDFAGFNGVKNGSTTDPNLTNVQTVNLVNDSGKTYTFNGKNTDGVENWNIENGPVNLSDLPDDAAAVGLKNIKQGAIVSIGFDEAVTKDGDASLTLNVDNVGTETTPVEGEPLSVRADKVSDVTVVAAPGSQNLVDLAGVAGAKDITVKGPGSVSLSDMGNKVQTVDASGLRGQFTATLDGGNAPETIKGGSGSDDTVILGSGQYSGKWSGIENAVVDGKDGTWGTYVELDGGDVTGLQNLVVNKYSPDSYASVNLYNITADKFTVQDSSNPERNFSNTDISGNIKDLQFVAIAPYDTESGKTRDVNIGVSHVGTNFSTDASNDATITVEEGLSLNGYFYFSQAQTLTMSGGGQFGGWGELYIDAPKITKFNADITDNSSLRVNAWNSDARVTIKGDANYLDLSSQSTTITDGAGSNDLEVYVTSDAAITGGGGNDTISIRASYPRDKNAPDQAELITVKIDGKVNQGEESYNIYGSWVENNMAVTITGYDSGDARIDTDNRFEGFADVDEAREKIFALYQDNPETLQEVRNDYKEVCGYYDASSQTAYGFTYNWHGDLNVGVKLIDIASYELAQHALGLGGYRYAAIDLEPGKYEYSTQFDEISGKYIDTFFWGTVENDSNVEADAYKSTLVPGIQITGISENGSPYNALCVNMYDDFNGLGSDGFTKGVQGLDLYDREAQDAKPSKTLTFNAENMSGVSRLYLADGQFVVTDLEKGLDWVKIVNSREQDATIKVQYSENALNNYFGALSLNVSGVGTAESPLKPVIPGVKNLDVYSGYGWDNDDLPNWLDISTFSQINSLGIYGSNPLNLTAQNMNTDEAVDIRVSGDQGMYVQGELQFNNAPTISIDNWGQIGRGSVEQALHLDAAAATDVWLYLDGATNLELDARNADVSLSMYNGGMPEFLNLKIYAAKTFYGTGALMDNTIHANSANIDLENVESQKDTLDLWTREKLTFQSAKSGSEVNADSREATLEGSSGNDTFRVHVSDSATASGNGGDDTFVAFANKGTHAEGEGPVQVTFNGSTGDDDHDTFIVNTWQNEANPKTNAKLALTITGYDKGDFLRVTNVSSDADGSDGAYVNFAVVSKDDATFALSDIFGINASELTNLVSEDGYSWLDSAKQCAYGFATDDSDNIIAAVRLDGVTDQELAHDAFAPGATQG